MWIPSDSAHAARPARRLALLLALAALFLPALLRAAVSPGRAALRQAILARYEVLPVRGGLLLKPHTSKVGVKTIEIAGGNIAINGETTPPSVVRAWLTDDAPQVLQLAELPTAELRQLFNLPAAEGGGAALPPLPAPPEPPKVAGKSGDSTVVIQKSGDSTSGTGDDEDKGAEAVGSETIPPEPPEAPEPPPTPTSVSSGPRVKVGGSTRVNADEVVESVVAVGGSVHVEGQVREDVAAIGGQAYVDGKIGGGVTAVGGSVHLGPHADVGGDVTSVLGHIDADPKARIHGTKTEVSPGDVMIGGPHHRPGTIFLWPIVGTASLVATALKFFLKLVLVGLTLLVARATVERLERRLVSQPWESAGVGLLTGVAFFPAVVLATLLTCCLLIVFYPVLILLVMVVGLLGYTTVAVRLGRWTEQRLGRQLGPVGEGGSIYLAALVGMVWLEGLQLLGALLSFDGLTYYLGAALRGLGEMVVLVALIFGVGVVLLDRFSTGWRRMPPAPPGASPMPPTSPVPPASPIPPAPPESNPPAPPAPTEPA
jgi:hypothetical protein